MYMHVYMQYMHTGNAVFKKLNSAIHSTVILLLYEVSHTILLLYYLSSKHKMLIL